MEIRPNTFYILKNSNDINDVIKVTNVEGNCIYFDYLTKEHNKVSHEITRYIDPKTGSLRYNRWLPLKTFEKCYKFHKVSNTLYGN